MSVMVAETWALHMQVLIHPRFQLWRHQRREAELWLCDSKRTMPVLIWWLLLWNGTWSGRKPECRGLSFYSGVCASVGCLASHLAPLHRQTHVCQMFLSKGQLLCFKIWSVGNFEFRHGFRNQ